MAVIPVNGKDSAYTYFKDENKRTENSLRVAQLAKMRMSPFWQGMDRTSAVRRLKSMPSGSFLIRPKKSNLFRLSAVEKNGYGAYCVIHRLFSINREGKVNECRVANGRIRRIKKDFENPLHFARIQIPLYIPLDSSLSKTAHLLAQFEWNITSRSAERTLRNEVGSACLTPGDTECCYLLHILEKKGDIRKYELTVRDEKIHAEIDGETVEVESMSQLLYQKFRGRISHFKLVQHEASKEFRLSQIFYQNALQFIDEVYWIRVSRRQYQEFSNSFYLSRTGEIYFHLHKNGPHAVNNGGYIDGGTNKTIWHLKADRFEAERLVRVAYGAESGIDEKLLLFKELRKSLDDSPQRYLWIPPLVQYRSEKYDVIKYAQIMPFLPGDLFNMRVHLNPVERLQAAKQVGLALSYLHDLGVAHLDVKPENVLVKRFLPVHVILIDFDYTKKIEGNEEIPLKGSLEYLDPNIIRGKAWGLEDAVAADQFAWASMLYILLLEVTINRSHSIYINAGEVSELSLASPNFYKLSPKLIDLLRRCLYRIRDQSNSRKLTTHVERPKNMRDCVQILNKVIIEDL